MRLFILILSALTINSCVSIHTTIAEQKPPTPNGVLCKDPDVQKLASYELPTPPDFNKLPKGDRVGEIHLLLDYIDTLKGDIKSHIRNYDCK